MAASLRKGEVWRRLDKLIRWEKTVVVTSTTGRGRSRSFSASASARFTLVYPACLCETDNISSRWERRRTKCTRIPASRHREMSHGPNDPIFSTFLLSRVFRLPLLPRVCACVSSFHLPSLCSLKLIACFLFFHLSELQELPRCVSPRGVRLQFDASRIVASPPFHLGVLAISIRSHLRTRGSTCISLSG